MNLITIDGLPVPWKAHAGYGKRSFNPRFKEKEYYQWQIKSQWNQNIPLAGPIFLKVVYHMPIPLGTSKVRRLQMLNQKMFHIKRPDLDNCNKFLEDCLKGIVFEDDSQVVQIHARKIYSEHPRTVVEIESMN